MTLTGTHQSSQLLRAQARLQVSFRPEISATYGLAIMLQGIQLQGSPFKIRVRNDETIAGNCRLYGSSLAVGTAGEPISFCIQGSHLISEQREARHERR